MYEKAIWPPKPSEPPKPKLGEGWVIRHRTAHFVVARSVPGTTGTEYVEGLRLFEIRSNGRLATYNRFNDLPAMDTYEYKNCTAIWRSVDDFVAEGQLRVVWFNTSAR